MRKSTKESINDSVSPKKLKKVILVILPKREWGGMGGGGGGGEGQWSDSLRYFKENGNFIC